MALIDVTPTMTGYNTPSPYIVTKSSDHVGWEAWKAFDNVSEPRTNTWYAVTGTDEYVQLDFGERTEITHIGLKAPTNEASYNANQPKHIKLFGSDDGIDFQLLYENQQLEFYPENQTNTLDLGGKFKYRFYKFHVVSCYGQYVIVGDIRYLLDEDYEKDKLTIHKTLKENLPSSIKAKRDEIHFTEDGEIYISKNDGKLMKCYSNIVASVGLDKKEW